MFIALLTLIFFVAMVASLAAQVYVSYVFGKWGAVENGAKLTGTQVVERIQDKAGLTAQLQAGDKRTGDHYDPRSHTVYLTEQIAEKPSVLAMAVTAHELGHAQQHQENSGLIQMRSLLVPAVQLSPTIAYALVTAGLFFGFFRLIWLGAFVFGLVVAFMFLTLPVEVDASRRGVLLLREIGVISNREDRRGIHQVLTAAALTYVAASVLSLSQLLRYISLARR
jgi:hypothetical protein